MIVGSLGTFLTRGYQLCMKLLCYHREVREQSADSLDELSEVNNTEPSYARITISATIFAISALRDNIEALRVLVNFRMQIANMCTDSSICCRETCGEHWCYRRSTSNNCRHSVYLNLISSIRICIG